MAFVHG